MRAWFASVVRSRARDRHRLDVHRTERESAVARPEATASAADVAAATEIHRGLAAALLALDEPYRSAVILRFAVDLRYGEIGTALECSEAAARRRVHDGLRNLRAAIPPQAKEAAT